MTDTPDKEWIERAEQFAREHMRFDPGILALAPILARELQSSYALGVSRERERCAAVSEAFGKRYTAISQNGRKQFSIYDVDRYVKASVNMVAEDIRALTPTPSDGER